MWSNIVLSNMQKMIIWRKDYDEFIQSVLQAFYEERKECFYCIRLEKDDTKNPPVFKFSHTAPTDELGINTVILNANLAYDNRGMKYAKLRREFPFKNLMAYLKQEKEKDNVFKYGLIRILNYCYVNFPGKKKYVGCKAYYVKNMFENFTQELEKSHINEEEGEEPEEEEHKDEEHKK